MSEIILLIGVGIVIFLFLVLSFMLLYEQEKMIHHQKETVKAQKRALGYKVDNDDDDWSE